MWKNLVGNRWITLGIVSLGLFIILIDATVVNVSIPAIIKDLNANLSDVEWVITGYALSFAALLITFGRIGDIYGRRLLFVAGMITFAVASFFSGEASNVTTLIIARLVQGVGGAMISPAVLSIISSTFIGRDRSIAFGVFGAMTGVAVAVGPILGGFFTTYYSWRWVFRINIPIAIVAVILAFFFIKESKETNRHPHLDISGMVTSSIGFFLLVFGLIEGQTYGWIHPSKIFQLGNFTWNNSQYSIIFASFILAIISLSLFLAIEYRKTLVGDQPAINLEFFKFRTYRYGLITVAVIALGEFSSLFTIPLFLQNVKGLTALESGIATLPLAVASFFAAPISAQLVNKLGSKWVITTGIVMEGIGIYTLSFLNVSTTATMLILPFVILGAGIGLAIAQNTQVILSDIPGENAGSASGVLNTIRQVGSALGIAIVGALLSAQIVINIPNQINKQSAIPTQVKQAINTEVKQSGGSFDTFGSQTTIPVSSPPSQVQSNPQLMAEYQKQIKAIGDAIKSAVNEAFVESIAYAIRFSSIFLFIGALLSLLIPTVKHEQKASSVAPAH